MFQKEKDMSLKVTNMELNADTANRITKRVLKDKNMRITDQFAPAVSDYTVNLNPVKRVKLNLTDDTFTCISQQKTGDKWTDMRTGCFQITGPLETLEEVFIKTVESLKYFMINK